MGKPASGRGRRKFDVLSFVPRPSVASAAVLFLPRRRDKAMSCLAHHGSFASDCAAGITLANCTSPALNGLFTVDPHIDALPRRFLGPTLRALKGSTAVALKVEKPRESEREQHDRVAQARVTASIPLFGRCALSPAPGEPVASALPTDILVSPWVESVPCTTTLRAAPERALRDSVDFFVDMTMRARLLDIDRSVHGWWPSPANGAPSAVQDRNILCRDPKAIPHEECAHGAAARGRSSDELSSSSGGSARLCGHLLLHHDFDAAVDLTAPRAYARALDALAGRLTSHGLDVLNTSQPISRGGAGAELSAVLVHFFFFSVVAWPGLLLDSWGVPHPAQDASWLQRAMELLERGCVASSRTGHSGVDAANSTLGAGGMPTLPTADEQRACARLAACGVQLAEKKKKGALLDALRSAQTPRAKPDSEAIIMRLFVQSLESATVDCHPAHWSWPTTRDALCAKWHRGCADV